MERLEFGSSPLSYFKFIFIGIGVSLFVWLIDYNPEGKITGWIVFKIVFLSLLFIFVVNNLLYLRSKKLIVDEKGVWLKAGYLPWSKGSNGIAWKNLDKAVYYTTFTAWLTKIYDIEISHNNKNESFTVSKIYKGDKAVLAINNFIESNNL